LGPRSHKFKELLDAQTLGPAAGLVDLAVVHVRRLASAQRLGQNLLASNLAGNR
jgi:hypothetical protein